MSGFTFNCQGCRRRKELIQGYWVILKNLITHTYKTLTDKDN